MNALLWVALIITLLGIVAAAATIGYLHGYNDGMQFAIQQFPKVVDIDDNNKYP